MKESHTNFFVFSFLNAQKPRRCVIFCKITQSNNHISKNVGNMLDILKLIKFELETLWSHAP